MLRSVSDFRYSNAIMLRFYKNGPSWSLLSIYWKSSLVHSFPHTVTELPFIPPHMPNCRNYKGHYGDVIMTAMTSQITSLTIVCTTVYLGADQRKHQSSASLAFVRGIHRGPVNSPHKGPVTRKMLPFDDVIMVILKTSPVSLLVDPWSVKSKWPSLIKSCRTLRWNEFEIC